jgi:hypothetical protein
MGRRLRPSRLSELRPWLKRKRPELVKEMVMLIKSLINTADGLGGKLTPGTVRDVPDSHAAMLIKRGLAEQVGVVMAKLDDALAAAVEQSVEQLPDETTFTVEHGRDEEEPLDYGVPEDDEVLVD